MPGTRPLQTLPGGVVRTRMCRRTGARASDRGHPVGRPATTAGMRAGTRAGGDGGLGLGGISHLLQTHNITKFRSVTQKFISRCKHWRHLLSLGLDNVV